jgi:hypothetical protein
MARKVQSKCLCCGDIFTVDVRNRGRQKYCPRRACRAAGKAARQRRWLSKPQNRNYFREPDNAARVREWQRAHPGYWRNATRYKRHTLQDALAGWRQLLLPLAAIILAGLELSSLVHHHGA